jgi:hypothetical protein
LNRRKIGINVFGNRSRYRTALLEIEDLPPLPPAHLIAKSFIGTTVYFRYPFLQEGFVCAVSDSNTIIRGKDKAKKFAGEEIEQRKLELAKLYKQNQAGAGMVGTGGVILPATDITLRLRPLAGVETLPDGSRAKVYAKFEVEVRQSYQVLVSVILIKSNLPRNSELNRSHSFQQSSLPRLATRDLMGCQ